MCVCVCVCCWLIRCVYEPHFMRWFKCVRECWTVWESCVAVPLNRFPSQFVIMPHTYAPRETSKSRHDNALCPPIQTHNKTNLNLISSKRFYDRMKNRRALTIKMKANKKPKFIRKIKTQIESKTTTNWLAPREWNNATQNVRLTMNIWYNKFQCDDEVKSNEWKFSMDEKTRPS